MVSGTDPAGVAETDPMSPSTSTRMGPAYVWGARRLVEVRGLLARLQVPSAGGPLACSEGLAALLYTSTDRDLSAKDAPPRSSSQGLGSLGPGVRFREREQQVLCETWTARRVGHPHSHHGRRLKGEWARGADRHVPLGGGRDDLGHGVVIPTAGDKGRAQLRTGRHIGWLVWGLAVSEKNEMSRGQWSRASFKIRASDEGSRRTLR